MVGRDFLSPPEARSAALELLQSQWESASEGSLQKLGYGSVEDLLSDARQLLREARQ